MKASRAPFSSSNMPHGENDSNSEPHRQDTPQKITAVMDVKGWSSAGGLFTAGSLYCDIIELCGALPRLNVT